MKNKLDINEGLAFVDKFNKMIDKDDYYKTTEPLEKGWLKVGALTFLNFMLKEQEDEK